MANELKVLVIMRDSLLESGLVQGLKAEPGLEVRVVLEPADDLAKVLSDFKPHAALVEAGSSTTLASILTLSPETSVMTLSLDKGGVTVYHPRGLSVRSIESLARHLKREHTPSTGSGNRTRRKENTS